MLVKITRRIRAQWGREFTLSDAALCIGVLLPVGIAVILFGSNL